MTAEELALSRSTPAVPLRCAAAPQRPRSQPRRHRPRATRRRGRALRDARSSATSPCVLFALEWCEFCWSVRKLFAQLGIAYRSVDLDSVEYQADDLGGRIRAVLADRDRRADDPADLHRRRARRRLHRPVRRLARRLDAAAAGRSTASPIDAMSTSIRTRCCRSGCSRARARLRCSAMSSRALPVIDISHAGRAATRARSTPRAATGASSRSSVTASPRARLHALEREMRAFFAQPLDAKRAILRTAREPLGLLRPRAHAPHA